MIDSTNQHAERSQRQRRLSAMTICAAGAMLAFAASLAALAFAGATTVTLGSAPNSTLGEQVVVNSQGRTLYALSPETRSHLLCKSSECLKFWPPVTAPSFKTKLKAASGVQGRLGILRRSNGTLQVTLRGLPLYRFVKDHGKGEANGQGIKSFGGTWHVVSASSATSTTPAAQPTGPSNPSSPSTMPPYGY
jgi:predicted lipoprotein with Yx(FWY)xxD motif